jgi:heterodisulfide reductase subunit C
MSPSATTAAALPEDPAFKLGPTYPEVPLAEKQRLFDAVRADERYPTYLHGCYECGVCVGACPSARYYDFSPRRIAQAATREDVELFYQQMVEDIWDCSQCFSCLRCPRGNNPGGVVTLMREVAVNNGLDSAKQAMKGYTRIIYKILSTGTQIAPDMLSAEAFPDWGPTVVQIADNLDIWRRALPPETLHTTSISWDVAEKTLLELYIIWDKTGALDVIADLDPDLHELLEEIMEDRLDEAGYER